VYTSKHVTSLHFFGFSIRHPAMPETDEHHSRQQELPTVIENIRERASMNENTEA